jgi:hypothetical protein
VPYKRVDFIDIPLTKQEKEQFKKWMSAQAESFDPVVAFLGQGYRLSFSWDQDNQCVACFVSTKDPDSKNSDCILTARSDEWHKAVWAAFYKHTMILNGLWRQKRKAKEDTVDY